MKTILWTQNESISIPDTIIVDGNRCNDPNQSSIAFNFLNQINQKLVIEPSIREKLYKKYREYGYSHQANFSVIDKGIYIQGCFKETDARGRRLPFMFYSADAKDIFSATNDLLSNAELLGKHCNKFELQVLEKEFYRLKNNAITHKKWFLYTILILFIIIILLLHHSI